jgi:hypothetical protein
MCIGWQQLGIAHLQRLLHELQDIAVELRHQTRLSLRSVTRCSARCRNSSGVKVIEEIEVAAADSAIPGGRSRPRHDDQSLRVDRVGRLHPVEEGNPVQQLEADFTHPRADDDRRRASRRPLQHARHSDGFLAWRVNRRQP